MARLLKFKEPIVLFFALGLLAFNCLHFIKNEVITFDETLSLYNTIQVQHYGFAMLTEDIHMLLYNFLLYVHCLFFGYSLTSAKLLSVFISMGTLFYLLKLSKRYYDLWTAALAILLTASSPIFVSYAHQTRSYALLIFLSAASSYYFLEFSETRKRAALIKYFLFSILLPFSHLVGFFVFVVQFLFVLFFRREKRIIFTVLGVHLTSILFFLPVVVKILSRYNLAKDLPLIYRWVPKPSLVDLNYWLRLYSGPQFQYVLNLSLWAFLALFCFRGLSRLQKNISIYLILWLATPPLILFIYSQLHTPIFISRGVASATVPMALLTGLAIRSLAARSHRLGFVLACIIILFSIYFCEKDLLEKGRADEMSFKKVFLAVRDILKTSPDSTVYFYPPHLKYNMAYFFSRDCFGKSEIEVCLKRNRIEPYRPRNNGNNKMTGDFITVIFAADYREVEGIKAEILSRGGLQIVREAEQRDHPFWAIYWFLVRTSVFHRPLPPKNPACSTIENKSDGQSALKNNFS